MSFSFNRNNESRIIKKTLTNNIPASITNSSSLGSSNVTGLINLTSTNISTNNFTLNGIPITASATELNKLTGTTAVTSDFNKLASVTASADELNKLTGTTATTTDFNKLASVTASAAELNKLTGTTATTTDFNKLASVTASADELNYNEITTVGTAEANKTLVVDSNKDITSIRNITSTGLTTTNLTLGATAVTASADELNKLTSTTVVTSDFNKLASVTASAAELNKLTGTTAVTSDFNKLASITASATELNKLTGTTVVTSDFNKLASVTASAAELNKLTGTTAVTSDFNKLASITASADELNKLTGTTVVTSDFNKLASVTASAAELNKLTGTTAVTSDFNKLASITASATELNKLTGTTAVTSDFNKLASVTASADELNTLTGISIGTASANKALIVDTNKDLNGIRNLSITGDLNIAGTTTTINSTQVNIKDNILQLNSGPSGIYDSGLIIQRYQTNNDNNIGDIINDSVKENYTASSVTINTIVLPSNANSNNNYYNGWWIKINSASTGTNQTRQVLSYNGSSKTLTLTNNFTTLPTGTISVNLYNKTFSNFIWQENNKRFITSYTAQDISGTLTILDYADLSTNNLSILSTADSQSSSIGGSLTVSGGASIAKKLYIGTDLLIGGNITLNNTLITATAADINKLAGTTAVTSDFNKLATITATATELNKLASTTAVTSDFNKLASITATATEINKLAGTTAVTADFNKLASITATAADINKLATVTASAAELNYNDITTTGTAEANKALILNVNKDITSIRNITATGLTITNLTLGSTAITATGAEINKLAGTTAITADFNKLASITASAAELNYNDITTIGTAEAGKALILDVNKDIISIRNITATGLTITNLTLGSTAITATGAEINKLAGTTAITADFNKLASVTATASQLNYLSGTTLGTITASKALTVDSSSNINSILQLKKTASGQQIYFENGTSTGTIYHTLNSSLNIGTISSNDLVFQTNNTNRVTITSTGLMNIQTGWQISGTTVTATAAELNYLDLTTGPGTAEANKSLVLNGDRDISNIRKIELNGNDDILTFTNTTTTGRSTIKFVGNTGSGTGRNWELGTRNATAAVNPNTFYLYDNSASSYRLIVDSDGDVNIVNHNGSTTGLQLNGTLVTATASELNILDGLTATTADLNYVDVTTEGTAQASKALVLDSNKDIISIRRISTTNISLNNATTYPTVLHCGSAAADRIIGVFNNTTSFYGFGAADNLLKIQGGHSTGIAFYTSASNSSIGTEQMRISSTSTSILQTTSSTNSTSGALIVSGGIGCAGSLNIASDINCSGSLTVGTVGSGPNRINFSGTTGDANNNHTVLAERIYSGTESSELLIFKGNDIPGGSGPDRIRLRTAEIRFQTYTTAEDYSSPVGDNNNRLIITNDGNIAFNGSQETSVSILPAAYNTYTYRPSSGGTSLSLGFISASNKASYILQSDLGHHISMGTNSGTYNTTLFINSLGTSGTSNVGNGICIETNKPANSSWTTLFRARNTTHSITTDLQVNDSAMAFGTFTSNTFSLMTNNTNRLNILSSGNIGIGTSSPGYPLHVSGVANYSGGFAFYAGSGSGTNTGTATNNTNTTIYASGRIVASEFNAFSDNRIKKNIIDINDISALNTLRLIQPKQYNYIDTLNKTSNPVLGFIAQQVSEVLDYSVNIIIDYIPNIFQTAIKSLSENNDTVLSFNNLINYDSNGTGKVKLIDENDKIIYVTIKNKINNYSFSINETLENIEYFIYGEEVNNYHSLNKDSIFTITTAAVQEIDRIVIEQKNKITTLENENQQLKDQIQNILIRLQNLENNN